MTTIAQALAQATLKLGQAGIENAQLDAGLLLAEIVGESRTQLLLFPQKPLSEAARAQFDSWLQRRIKKEPIAYIIGKKEFWSLDFCVTYDTLIPRPDSETLVEAALKRIAENAKNNTAQGRAKPITLLDIGTGTGCLLIALLKELPHARGIGVDNNTRTLKVAHENAKRLGVETRAQFLCSNWCDALNGTFDLILSNPPYITREDAAMLMQDVRDYEPYGALVSGVDGLECYRELAPQVSRLLNEGGFALFEVGQGQSGDVSTLMLNEGLLLDGFKQDLAGIERCIVVRKPLNT